MELTETIKSKVCSDIKAYITGEWKEQTKNKFAEELSAEIEKATEDQFRFGDPPSYERGYLRGNITATGGRNDGDVEYTRTINVDLKTQEFTFFDIDEDDGRARKMCERACKSVSFMKNSFYTWEKIKDSSKKQGIYTCDNYDEALQDFAESECEEAFYRINLYLKDCRINEATYFETKPMQICHYYPVYFDTTYRAAYAYGISSIPTTYFINADGTLEAQATGMISAAQLEQGIRKILN